MPVMARASTIPHPAARAHDQMLVSALIMLVALGGSALQPTWRSLPFAAWIVVGAATAAWHYALNRDAFSRTLIVLALAPLAVPLIQLCPVPVAWLDLSSGQAFVGHVRHLVQPGMRASISVDRVATAVATVPVAVFSTALLLFYPTRDRARAWLFASFAMLGAISVMLGLVQFLTGGEWGDLYGSPHAANAPGLFANRNHGATFLACCLVFAGVWIGRRRMSLARRQWWFACAALPALAVVALTGSRAGLLIGAAMAVATLLVLPTDGAGRGAGRMRPAIVAGIAGFALAVVLLPLNGGTAERLGGVGDDLRWSIWSHSRDLARLFWPWGSGLGTFAQVYPLVEPVGELHPFYINHAHNDLLEVIVELGILAALPVVAAILFATVSLTDRVPRDRHRRLERRAAMIVIVGLFAHSVVDYPLRTPALAIVLAFACALLAPTSRRGDLVGARRSRPQRAPDPVPPISFT